MGFELQGETKILRVKRDALFSYGDGIIRVGKEVRFGGGGYFQVSKNALIDIKDNCFIGIDCYFLCDSLIEIGENCLIAPRVAFIDNRSHTFLDRPRSITPIKIGKGSWIGYGAIILEGVELGEGCVVGAGSVVTRSFKDKSFIAGNPAKVIE